MPHPPPASMRVLAFSGILLSSLLQAGAAHAQACPATAGDYVVDDGDTCVLQDGSSFNNVEIKDGALMLEPGASVRSGSLRIGTDPSATMAVVNISGPAALWSNQGPVIVGDSADGALIIDGGGRHTSGSAMVGATLGSDGSATVEGAGSEWINAGGLILGKDGLGTLAVLNQGSVRTGSLTIGGGQGTGSLVLNEGGSLTSMAPVEVGAGGFLDIGGQVCDGACPTPPLAPGHLHAPSVLLQTGGALNFNHDSASYEFSTPITGTGNVFHWAGTTILTGDNTYTGDTVIQGGTLVIGDGGTRGNIAGDIYNDSLLIFNRGDDTAYHGSIQGTGGMIKAGAGTLTLTGTSAYLGGTAVAEGRLTVNGAIYGSGAVVGNGATLGGTGILPPTFVAAGGALAPGDPYGQLTVCCGLAFEPGSYLDIRSSPSTGAVGSVYVKGRALLAGKVRHLAGTDSAYAVGTRRYTILQAEDGLDGRFDGVESQYAFLDAALAYDLERYKVFLDLTRNRVMFADTAQTANQRNVAAALDSVPPTSPLYQAVANLGKGEAPAAFDALSGEVHASASSFLYANSQRLAALPLQHLRRNLHAGLLPGATLASAGGNLPQSALPQSGARPLWAEALGSRRVLRGDGNAATAIQNSSGIFLGGDYPLGRGSSDDWRLGLALGYLHSRNTVDDRGSRAKSDDLSAILYGGRSFSVGPGKLNALLGAGYTRHKVDTSRRVSLAGQTQQLTAAYTADSWQAMGELGYALSAGSYTIEPFLGLSAIRLHMPGFQESGGSAALRGYGSRSSLGSGTLGLRTRVAFDMGTVPAQLSASVAWRRAWGDLDTRNQLAFNEGGSFRIAGVPISRDAAVVGLVLNASLSRNAGVALSYGGEFGRRAYEHSGRLSVNWRF